MSVIVYVLFSMFALYVQKGTENGHGTTCKYTVGLFGN